MANFRQPGEIARRRRRKYLWYGLFVRIRDFPVIVKEITAHVLAVSPARFLCPFVVFRSVIHDKVHADVDVFPMAGRRQGFQVFHRAEFFLHLPEIGHRVTAVGTPFRRIQKRHEMNVIDMTFFQIVEFRRHAFHIAGKIINIEHHAEHIVLFIPVRAFLPLAVRYSV